MPHFPKPFFKQARGCWYVEIDRRQHNLGADREAAFRRYHELMGVEPGACEPQLKDSGLSVVAVIDEFLDWVQKHKAPLTYTWYRDRTQAFARSIGQRLRVSELKPIHVERWVDGHPHWSASYQRGCKIAVQRALRWADRMGVIDKSPLGYLEKPEAGTREQVISPGEYPLMLDRFGDEAFRSVLEMPWHTGARPQDRASLVARHTATRRTCSCNEGRFLRDAEDIVLTESVPCSNVQCLPTASPRQVSLGCG